MATFISKQRLYASLLILGACVVLFRTITMICDGSLAVLVLWVSALLITEFSVDIACLLSSISWWISNDKNKASTPLKLGATAAIVHAVRVLIFVMGRVGPWIDFDVRPEHRALHSTRWTWFGVYFASVLTILGLIGVFVIWTIRRRARGRKTGNM
ncbi:MAG: hypothetical protein PVI51_08240 [candidate division WOR-3 bacterium]|jgi:hypothetical protein